jgi:hypothetical protein
VWSILGDIFRLVPVRFHEEKLLMSRRNLVWAVLVLALGAPSLAAQETLQDEEADHEALRRLRAVVEQAVNENRLELLRPHLHESFWVVTYTDRQFSDFDAFKTRWEQTRQELLDGGSYQTKLLPERSIIVGEIAIARGNSENVLVTGDGAEYRFPSHWSAVLRKVDGDWKIVQAHSSLSPFDNPMMMAAVKGLLLKVGAGAAATGLVVGWLTSALFVFLRRRRAARHGATGNV